MAPLFEGHIVATNLMFPETLPRYVTNAATLPERTRAPSPCSALPGADFGYYRWGVTMDAVWSGLLTRPYIQRQAVLQGEPASANLLRALDESIQDGVFDPATLVPMARLMGASNVLLQSDLQYERFDTPAPPGAVAAAAPPATGDDLRARASAPRDPLGTARRTDPRRDPAVNPDERELPARRSRSSRSPTRARCCAPSRCRTRSCSPATARGCCSRRAPGCSTAAVARSSTRPPRRRVGLQGPRLGPRHRARAHRHERQRARHLGDAAHDVRLRRGGRAAACGLRPLRAGAPDLPRRRRPPPRPCCGCMGIRSVTASGYGNPVANAPEAAALQRRRRQLEDGVDRRARSATRAASSCASGFLHPTLALPGHAPASPSSACAPAGSPRCGSRSRTARP